MKTSIIGKIGVAIHPDTSKFHKEAQAALAEEEKRLDPVEVPLEADKAHLHEEVTAAVAEEQARAGDIEVEIKADKDKLHEALKDQKAVIDVEYNFDKDALKEAAKQFNDIGKNFSQDLDDALNHLDDNLKDVTQHVNFEVDEGQIKDAFAQLDDLGDSLSKDINDRFDQLDKRVKDFNDENIDIDVEFSTKDAEDLKKMLDGLDDKKIQVEVEADTKKAKNAFNELENLSKALSTTVDDAFDHLDESLGKNIDEVFDKTTKRISDDIDHVVEKLGDAEFLQDTDIRVHLDDSEAMADAEKLSERLKKKLQDITPEVILNGYEKARHDIGEIQNKLQDIAKQWRAKIQVGMENLGFYKVKAQLANLARTRFVTLIPKVSKVALAKAAAALGGLTGATGLKNYAEDVKESVVSIVSNLPKLALVGTMIAGLGVQIGATATNMFSLAGSIAQIGPAALALPAILAGIASATIVTVVAFSQMSKVLPDVVKRFKGLKQIISDNFWAEAKKPIQELADVMLPKMEVGFGKVAKASGDFFGSLAKGFEKQVVPDLEPMFDNLAKAIHVAADHTESMAQIIGILGKTGSQYLPILAQNFGKVTDKFANFLEQASKTGELKQWIDQAIQSIKELWNVATGAASILSGLSKAALAAGGSTLKSLGDNLHAIADVINSPTFQSAMTGAMKGFLKGAELAQKQAGEPLRKMFLELAHTAQTALPQIGQAFGDLLGGIAKLIASPSFQGGLEKLAYGLSQGLQGALPYWTKIGDGVGAFAKILGNLAEHSLPFIAKGLAGVAGVVEKLQPHISNLTDGFFKFANVALDALLEALDQVSGPIGQLMDALGGLLLTLTPLIKPLTTLAKDLLTRVANIITKMINTGVIGDLATFLGNLLDSVDGLIDPLGDLVEALGVGLANALAGMAKDGTLKALADGIGGVVAAVADVLPGITTLVTALFDGAENSHQYSVMFSLLAGALQTGAVLLEMLAGLFNGVAYAIAGLIDISSMIIGVFTKGLPDAFHQTQEVLGKFQGWLQALPGNLKKIGASIINGLLDGMKSVIKNVLDWLDKIGPWIIDHKGPPAKDAVLLKPAGASIMTGLLNGMKSKLDAIKTWLGKLTQDIKDIFSKAGTWLVNKGSALISGLRSGISQRFSDVTRRLSDLKTAILNKFSSAGTWLASKGRELVNGLRDGISGVSSRVGTAAKGLLRAAQDGIAGAGTALYNAGARVVNGFVEGLRSMFWKVSSVLSNLTSKLPDWKGPASTDSKILNNAGELVIQGFIDGMESQYDAVKDSLRGLTEGLGKTVVNAPGVKVAGSQYAESVQGGSGPGGRGGVNIYQTNYNPVSEPTSVKTNKALQTAAAFGFA